MPTIYVMIVIAFAVVMYFMVSFYFDSVFGAAHRSRHRILYIGIFLGLHAVYYLFNMPSNLSSIIAIVMIFSLAQSYTVSLGSRIVFSFIYIVLLTIINSLAIYLFFDQIDYSVKTPYELIQGNYGNFVKMLTFTSLSILAVTQLIRLFIRRRSFSLPYRYYLLFLMIPLISVFQINVLLSTPQRSVYFAIAALGLLFLNVFVIYLFDMLIERFQLANQNRYLKQQMDYQDANYEKTVHTFKDIKRIIHDTNQHLLYIEECIRQNEPEAASEHIQTTLNKIENAYMRVNTGNLVIDALVSNTLSIAQSNGIRTELQLRLHSQQLEIERYDLCVVLGNLLDNAIEASKKVRIADDRYMLIKIHSNESALYLHIANHTDQEITSWATGKESSDYHGLGLTNISRLCDKYGGHLTMESKSHRVDSMVVLPFSE